MHMQWDTVNKVRWWTTTQRENKWWAAWPSRRRSDQVDRRVTKVGSEPGGIERGKMFMALGQWCGQTHIPDNMSVQH